MSRAPVVAIVGRPNVGKSTLVNRILRRRAAVVEEKPGVTRDRKEFEAEWGGKSFVLVDTGGWAVKGDALEMGVREQAEVALAGADVVVFVADAKTAVTEDDLGVARLIQQSDTPHLLVANKVDGPNAELDIGALWSLGLGEPIAVSALHGRNTGDFLDRLASMLPDYTTEEGEDLPTLAIIGRPNVGKSTLLNRLVGEDRVLVSPEPGTTRDSIEDVIELGERRYRIVDTAGIRRPARIDEPTEFYSVIRARQALRQADVALFMVDGVAGVTHQEQRLADEVRVSGAGIVVLLNKWDAVTTEERLNTEDGLGDRLAFLSWAPVLRLSALSGARMQRLPAAIEMVLENRQRRIPTPILNRLIRKWQEATPSPARKGKRARIIYAVQAGVEPPTIVLFVRSGQLGEDYLRFLEKRLRDEFDFTGTPLRFFARSRSRSSAGV